jgi:hypothetical protein
VPKPFHIMTFLGDVEGVDATVSAIFQYKKLKSKGCLGYNITAATPC